MTSILDSEYKEQTRPYSQNEIKDMRYGLYRELRLSKSKASHSKCRHFYLVKKNGKKEKEIKNNSENIGNCSICWKIAKTPKDYKDKAHNLVNAYCFEFYEDPPNMDYNLFDIENTFYRWLYSDSE